nr:PUR family DNA/RNA-binding protein [Niabella ginsengisoli]
MEAIYSKRLRAGKRRTYFFDVRSTKGNDYYLTITESRKRFDDNGYDRHKVFLYKEDFNKFLKALNEAVEYVKTDLMPDFDFDAFNHDEYEEDGGAVSHSPATGSAPVAAAPVEEQPNNDEKVVENVAPKTDESGTASTSHEEVDKW